MTPLPKTAVLISYIAETLWDEPYLNYAGFCWPTTWRPYSVFFAIEEGLTTQ